MPHRGRGVTSTRRTTSSRTGSRNSGARTTSGCCRSNGSTIPRASFTVITAWAAKAGRRTGVARRRTDQSPIDSFSQNRHKGVLAGVLGVLSSSRGTSHEDHSSWIPEGRGRRVWGGTAEAKIWDSPRRTTYSHQSASRQRHRARGRLDDGEPELRPLLRMASKCRRNAGGAHLLRLQWKPALHLSLGAELDRM